MNLIIFFASYFLLLLSSSLVITSFYCITRGTIEITPNGLEKKTGKILRNYYFFWFQKKGKKNVRYTGDQLAGLLWLFRDYYTEPIVTMPDEQSPPVITKFRTSATFLQAIPILRNKFGITFKLEEKNPDTLVISAYSDDIIYRFPEWLRTVMAGCITCTPTVYGNIIYWSFILFFKKNVLYASLFGCFQNEYVGITVVWLAFWISLAWLNTVLWNIYSHG